MELTLLQLTLDTNSNSNSWIQEEITLELNDQGQVQESSSIPKAFFAQFEGKLYYCHIDNNNYLYLYSIHVNPYKQFYVNKFNNYVMTQLNSSLDIVVFLNTILPATDFVAFFAVFYQALNKHLHLNNFDNFRALIITLDSEKITAIFEAMKDQLPNIIKTAYAFVFVLEYLTPDQRKVLFEATKDGWLNTINTIENFCYFWRHPFSAEKKTLALESMKDHLLDIIDSVWDFEHVSRSFTPEQVAVVFEGKKDHWRKIIKYPVDLQAVVLYLTPEQQSEVFDDDMKDHWSKIIKTVWDFSAIFSSKDEALNNKIYQAAIQKNWLITADINETEINVLNASDPIIYLNSYFTWLESELGSESDEENKFLIETRMEIIKIAKNYLYQARLLNKDETPNVRQGLMSILSASMPRSDERIALLIPESSMTASLFKRTISPKGEELFRDIFGVVPDPFLGSNPPSSRPQMR